MFEVNVTSALAARAVVPAMIGGGEGKIINICSVLSEVARPSAGAYATTKAALKMLTQSMCAEWAPHGIQANAIGPGYIKTELNRERAGRARVRLVPNRLRRAAEAALRRPAEPPEIAAHAAWLCSEQNSYLTGQVVAVGGGVTITL